MFPSPVEGFFSLKTISCCALPIIKDFVTGVSGVAPTSFAIIFSLIIKLPDISVDSIPLAIVNTICSAETLAVAKS